MGILSYPKCTPGTYIYFLLLITPQEQVSHPVGSARLSPALNCVFLSLGPCRSVLWDGHLPLFWAFGAGVGRTQARVPHLGSGQGFLSSSPMGRLGRPWSPHFTGRETEAHGHRSSHVS